MVRWNKLFNLERSDHSHRLRDEMRSLLPTNRNDLVESAMEPADVTKVALRLKYQIEQVVSCEMEESIVTKANSSVITRKVIMTAKDAGGEEHRGIELEENQDFLISSLLLKRYSTLADNKATEPANAVERAVDIHALRVIGSSGYQKCISYLWRGWLVQDDGDPACFIAWGHKGNTNFWAHFDPDRMRAPQYQNAVQVFFSVMFLVLYTVAINTINSTGDLDAVEGVLYIMTAGFMFDEIAKFWKVGRYYVGFWNVFNSTLYALLCTSFVLRIIALSHHEGDDQRRKFNELSYNFLAFSAPMFWTRLLLYLDTFRFFGAMLVVLKVMMKESLIFFALLIIVMVGFLQAFIGMDQVDDNGKVTSFILQAMANSVMQSPDFTGFEKFAPPFGIILYYIFTFVVMVVLLNILIALFNSAYEDITDNAIDEYMALFAQKTMQFVRAPDENVFIAPFNLIEIFCLILPFEWWMSAAKYERLNHYVMGIIYSPLLLITAYIETKQAHVVTHNRRNHDADEATVEEWEQMQRDCDFEGDGWAKKVEMTKPNVQTDAAVLEVRGLKDQVGELKKLVEELKGEPNGDT